MLPLQECTPSECLPSFHPSNEINYAALSRAPESTKVFSHALMDRGCFGCCLLHCPYGATRKNMELKAATAAEKLLFIKCSHSMAGDLHNSWELRCNRAAFAVCRL